MKLVCALLFGFLLAAQTADVTILSHSDSREARAAYADMKAAEDKWADLTKRLKRAYGIAYEAEFSKDFRAVVPKQATNPWHYGSYYGPCWWNSSVLTVTPTTGTTTSFLGSTSLTANIVNAVPVNSGTVISDIIAPPTDFKPDFKHVDPPMRDIAK